MLKTTHEARHNNNTILLIHGEVNNKVVVGVNGTVPEKVTVSNGLETHTETVYKSAIVGKEIMNDRDEPVNARCWFALDLETGRGGVDEHPSWYPGSIKYAKISWAELHDGPSNTTPILKQINNETLAIEGIEANNLV